MGTASAHLAPVLWSLLGWASFLCPRAFGAYLLYSQKLPAVGQPLCLELPHTLF